MIKKNVEASGASLCKKHKMIVMEQKVEIRDQDQKYKSKYFKKPFYFQKSFYLDIFRIWIFHFFLSIFIKCFTLCDMLRFFKQCFGALFCVRIFEIDGAQNILSLFYMNVRVEKGVV